MRGDQHDLVLCTSFDIEMQVLLLDMEHIDTYKPLNEAGLPIADSPK